MPPAKFRHRSIPAALNTSSSYSAVSRRRFLSILTAGAGSIALPGCGGDSGASSSGAAVANASSAPRALAHASANASADGAAVPPLNSITDSNGSVWTINQGVIERDGNAIGYTHSATLLLWVGAKIYHRGTFDQFYEWTGSDWAKSSDPRAMAALASSSKLFYGMNGHLAYNSGIYETMSAGDQLSLLKDLGATNYRVDVASGGMAQTIADALNGSFSNSGVSILPVINPRSAHWDPTGSESDAYTLGHALGAAVATPLKGLVNYIECGNELDTVGLKISGSGISLSDWSPSLWPSFRGIIRGMVDGVRSVDSTIACGVGVGNPMGFRALQMLWNGVSPDGSADGTANARALRWDFTCFHWYQGYGDIQCGGAYNACIDVLQILKDSFGVPIWLTEIGWAGSLDTPSGEADYITSVLSQYHSIKDRYGLQSVMPYALIDGTYGFIQPDGTTRNPAYYAYRDYVAANPV